MISFRSSLFFFKRNQGKINNAKDKTKSLIFFLSVFVAFWEGGNVAKFTVRERGSHKTNWRNISKELAKIGETFLRELPTYL